MMRYCSKGGAHFACDVLLGFFVEFSDLGERLLGRSLITGGPIDPPRPVVRIGLLRIQFHGALNSGDGSWILSLFRQNSPQIEMRDANVVARLQSFPEQRYGSIEIVSLHRNIAKIRQGLRVVGVNRQLALELGLSPVVLLQLPMQVETSVPSSTYMLHWSAL
jgi:hypothetical protein